MYIYVCVSTYSTKYTWTQINKILWHHDLIRPTVYVHYWQNVKLISYLLSSVSETINNLFVESMRSRDEINKFYLEVESKRSWDETSKFRYQLKLLTIMCYNTRISFQKTICELKCICLLMFFTFFQQSEAARSSLAHLMWQLVILQWDLCNLKPSKLSFVQ